MFSCNKMYTRQDANSQDLLPLGGLAIPCRQSACAKHYMLAALAQVSSLLMCGACHMLCATRQQVLSKSSGLRLCKVPGADSEPPASATRRSLAAQAAHTSMHNTELQGNGMKN